MARRIREEPSDSHERWLVSYADFITLLFAFFVVMYSLSSVNQGKYNTLQVSLINAFNQTERGAGVNPYGRRVPKIIPLPDSNTPGQSPPREHVRSMADGIRRALEPLGRSGQVTVTETDKGISIEINASVLFPPGDATLDMSAIRLLRTVAQVVAEGEFPVAVEGHTDVIPISTPMFPSNWELSAVRASSVVRLFIESGVMPHRLRASGYADQRPVADNATPEGRARNRRVNILIESDAPKEPEELPPQPATATMPQQPAAAAPATSFPALMPPAAPAQPPSFPASVVQPVPQTPPQPAEPPVRNVVSGKLPTR